MHLRAASRTTIGLGAMSMLLAGCTQFTPAAMPTGIPDGVYTHRFQANPSLSAFEYSGEWKGGVPQGKGSGRGFDINGTLSATCKGDFRTLQSGYLEGDGEIYRPDGTVLFRGQLTGSLTFGAGCMAGSKGTYISPTGWTVSSEKFTMVSFSAGVYLLPGSTCTLGDPQGNTWTGTCNLPAQSKHANIAFDGATYSLPYLEVTSQVIHFTALGIVNFTLANGPGVMRYANGEQVQGNFDLGHLDDGLVQVTSPDGKVSQAMVSNGKLGPRHMASSQLASAKSCGFPGWRLASGTCEQNSWSGTVDAYDASGMERIAGPFKKGVPAGTVTWSRLDSGLQIRGTMVAVNGGLGFTKGQVSINETPIYEGEISGFAPNGNGICTVDGSPERCEYSHGERIDALYKTRLENNRLRREMAANQEAQQLAQQQAAARQQAQAQAEADSGGGDLFGKVMAIGIGAGAVSSVSGVSSEIRNQMITGMAADILTDGQAGGIATAQQNLGVQNAGSVQPAVSALSGASMGSNGVLKGSSAVASHTETDASNATLQNIAGIGSTPGHAERSQQLDDIVAQVAADAGMKTYDATYQCSPEEQPQHVTVPYKSEACRVAKQNWFQVYACNDVEHMGAANQKCLESCGNAGCDEQ
ncbi:hypothetical protein [Pseudomonas sp. Gutcm_11s]|uniref:hypothetical protein n=1 Tax=Pseudomonas sp. Gutcm_11s TaxID=3026088 RepID=UPI00236197A0|nr:hypothetical protein [Pseudomonas sp. Gutcm_11s]MDD0842552.1 hypothetical protein [Pseudomonas sp. Gutcm_11s]